MSTFIDLIEPWLLEDDGDDLLALRDELAWLKEELFDEYEPNKYERFDDRLAAWLQNLPDGDDRKALFRLLRHLFFIGKRQFDALCRAAFNDDITRWVVDVAGLDILHPDIAEHIATELQVTWFCPITDSMRINSFLKLNGLTGFEYRPDWTSLHKFGNINLIKSFITDNGIERLVLLEDFVGSGNQMRSTIEWAASFLNLPVLVIPLVCCPEGVRTGARIATRHQSVTFSPTLSLRDELFLTPAAQHGEDPLFAIVRAIVLREKDRLGKWKVKPFGYEHTGALIAMYSNCPDNTLPMIHDVSQQWVPLFARVQRS